MRHCENGRLHPNAASSSPTEQSNIADLRSRLSRMAFARKRQTEEDEGISVGFVTVDWSPICTLHCRFPVNRRQRRLHFAFNSITTTPRRRWNRAVTFVSDFTLRRSYSSLISITATTTTLLLSGPGTLAASERRQKSWCRSTADRDRSCLSPPSVRRRPTTAAAWRRASRRAIRPSTEPVKL